MVTVTLSITWMFAIIVPIYLSVEEDNNWGFVAWGISSLLWLIPLFTGVEIKNNMGQYTGYVVATEQHGAIFKGWNIYLKTQLESSNEDMACINREDEELIQKIKEIQESKESKTFIYEGTWQYAIGKCPGANWMIIGIK